jgi:hypothetical protein
MARFFTALLVVLTLLATPLWLLMAGFSFALLDGTSAATTLQKMLGSLSVVAIWLVPVWVLYFAKRMFSAWRGVRSPLPAAFMMALPALAVIGFFVAVNLRFAP